MHIRYSYKSYKESKVATAISLMGGICNALGKVFILFLLIEVGKNILYSNKVENTNLASVIIFCAVMAVFMFIMGFILNKIAKNKAIKEFKKMLELSYEEAEKLVDKKPKLKEWFMEYHPEYREVHKDENINKDTMEDKKITEKKKKKLLIIYACLILVVVIITAIFNKDNKESNKDSLNDDKYQCYISLNNDIVNCYEISINPYLKDKGTNEKIHDSYEQDKVQITPINEGRYKELDKAREASKKNPKMDVDKDINKLVDATEKIYDLIGQIYYAYGGQEYGKKTDKTKDELHKEFLSAIGEYGGLYENFSTQLDKISITYMAKELEVYKKNNDMDSYHTLNVMIKAEKIYEYFVDNNITNKNLFSMNLDDYNKVLEDYNKAFDEFKKRDIKGGTVHTTSFVQFTGAYHSFVNNIVDMVNQKNFDEGKLDAPKGLVRSGEDDDIQKRLYFYIDRLTSAYNSIQLFKK